METAEKVAENPSSDVALEDIPTPDPPEESVGTENSDQVVAESVDSPAASQVASPKLSKPVLGKLQAKKRLMAFANKFNTMPSKSKKTVKQKEGRPKSEWRFIR